MVKEISSTMGYYPIIVVIAVNTTSIITRTRYLHLEASNKMGGLLVIMDED